MSFRRNGESMISTFSFQGIEFTPFTLNTYKLYRDLHFLCNDTSFNNATVLHPIKAPEDFFILHSYFSRVSIRYRCLRLCGIVSVTDDMLSL